VTDWYSIIHEPETATAHVVLRDDIGCGDKTHADLIRDVEALKPNVIDLTVNSRGGDSVTGLTLYSFFRRHETHALIAGRCYSAALTAVMGAQTVRITPESRILIHSPARYCLGNAEELLSAACWIELLAKEVEKILIEHTEQPPGTVRSWLGKDTCLNAQESLQVGLVHEIAEPAPSRRSTPLPHCADVTEPPVSVPMQVSESEKFFRTILCAMPDVETTDPEAFATYVHGWIIAHVKRTQEAALKF
jgi:ATP-dependent protease ClpP protease subunit